MTAGGGAAIAGAAAVRARRRTSAARRPTSCGTTRSPTSRRCSTATAPSAWEQIRARSYDQFSLYEFLKQRGFSEGAIEYYAVMNFVEADMNNAVVEILREDLGAPMSTCRRSSAAWIGCPTRSTRELQQEVRFGAEVRAIDQADDGVTVHFKTEAGRVPRQPATTAICTLPFSVPADRRARPTVLAREDARHPPAQLPRVDQDPVPGPPSVLGGRGRHRRRGDRDRPADPAHELSAVVDRHDARRAARVVHVGPGRAAVGRDGSGDAARRGARRRGADPPAHPRGIRGRHVSYAWYGDRWARGAFALFAPDQQTDLQAAIVAPEGRVHFAGEHCSLYHAWIQGALESGIRAANEVHKAE